MNQRKWLKEPLLHFLLAGAGLFVLAGWLDPGDERGNTITIDEEQLLEHLQARSQLYDRASFEALLAKMSDEERRQLVEEAAQTEALYREGQALGLADADPLVKQRVIQQMRQLLMEEGASAVRLTDADVRAFYDAQPGRYAQGARVSFGHVFFSEERRGDMAREDAAAALRDLQEGGVTLDRSGEYGDRFLYQRNYAQAGEREIASQFGNAFENSLFALHAGKDWEGPIESDYGWHLVLLRAIDDADVPPFAEIADRVREDALAEARSARARAALDRLMERYKVVER